MEELRSEPICKRAQHLTHDSWNFFSPKFSLPLRRRRGAFARLQMSSFFLANMFHIFIKHNPPSSPLPVVFPATRWLSLRLFTPSFNLNICVYASCYCTIMDILQCRFTYHTRCASQQQFDSSKMCSVCSRLSLDCAWDFNSTDNLSQRSTRKVGKTNWMELCTGLSLSSASELFPRKTNIQHMMVFLQIWILVSSASIVCAKLSICFSTANKERKLAWFSIFTRRARNEWTFPNNKYSSQRHIFSDIASKHTQPLPRTFDFASLRLSQSSHQ